MESKIKTRQRYEWYTFFHKRKMIRTLRQELQSTENILNVYLGKVGKANSLIAFTDKRIILISHGFIARNVKSILWNNISDIHYTSGILSGYVEIDLLKDNIQIKTLKKTASDIYDVAMSQFFKRGD